MRYARIFNNTVAEIRSVGDKRYIIHSGRKVYRPRHGDYQAAGWLPVIEPVVRDEQILGDFVVYENKVMQAVVAKPREQVAAELAAHIKMIDMAVRQYIDDRVHWTAGPMIFDKARAKMPKSKAIKEWTEALWQEYYTRVAMLENGEPFSESMLDFSIIGPMPYPIKEAMME